LKTPDVLCPKGKVPLVPPPYVNEIKRLDKRRDNKSSRKKAIIGEKSNPIIGGKIRRRGPNTGSVIVSKKWYNRL